MAKRKKVEAEEAIEEVAATEEGAADEPFIDPFADEREGAGESPSDGEDIGKVVTDMEARFGAKISQTCPTFDVDIDLVRPNAWNPNVQDDETFNLLSETIEQEGWDQPCVVTPVKEADGTEYLRLIKGEHRWKVARIHGQVTIPVVFKEKWDEWKQKVMTVRDNQLRGNLDRRKFTTLVNEMRGEVPTTDLHDMARDMGFASEEEFNKFYVAERRRRETAEKQKMDDTKKELRMVDNLSHILNEIFLEYGSTVPQGFMFFMYKGKMHLMLEMNAGLKQVGQEMVGLLKVTGEEMASWLSEAIRMKLKTSVTPGGVAMKKKAPPKPEGEEEAAPADAVPPQEMPNSDDPE